MKLVRSKRQSNEEIFVGMTREGLERHLLRHEEYTTNVLNIHHDIESGYIKGFVLPNSGQNQKKLVSTSRNEKARKIHLSNLWYGHVLGTFHDVDLNMFPDDYRFTRFAKLGYSPIELITIIGGVLYSLGTRVNVNDHPFCFKPIVPKEGLPPIGKNNLDSARRYFTAARQEMMCQLGLPRSGSLNRQESQKLVERIEDVSVTVPIYL